MSAAGDEAGRGAVNFEKYTKDEGVDTTGMEVVFQCLRERVCVVVISTGDVKFFRAMLVVPSYVENLCVCCLSCFPSFRDGI